MAAECEPVFSCCGNIVSAKRCRLQAGPIAITQTVRFWLRMAYWMIVTGCWRNWWPKKYSILHNYRVPRSAGIFRSLNHFNHHHFILCLSMIITISVLLTHQSFHFIILLIMIDNDRCATLPPIDSPNHCCLLSPSTTLIVKYILTPIWSSLAIVRYLSKPNCYPYAPNQAKPLTLHYTTIFSYSQRLLLHLITHIP